MKKFTTEKEILFDSATPSAKTEGEKALEKYLNRNNVAIILAIIPESGDYVKTNESEYADQLDNFAAKLALPEYQTQYGYDADFIAEATADAVYNRYGYTKRTTVKPYEASWTAKKNEIRFGKGITVTPFTPGANVSSPPTSVLPGNEERFRTKAQSLKDNPNTTEAAELDFGIATPHKGTDTSTAKPILSIKLIDGGHPQISYTRGIFQGIELMVDRGDGKGMVLLDKPSNVKYVDNTTLPAAGVSAVWKYQAIYRLDDGRIGLWSLIVPVTVVGV